MHSSHRTAPTSVRRAAGAQERLALECCTCRLRDPMTRPCALYCTTHALAGETAAKVLVANGLHSPGATKLPRAIWSICGESESKTPLATLCKWSISLATSVERPRHHPKAPLTMDKPKKRSSKASSATSSKRSSADISRKGKARETESLLLVFIHGWVEGAAINTRFQ